MLNLVIFNPTSTQPLLNWNLGNTNEKENKNMKDKCYILNNGDVLRMQVKDDWGDEQERRQHSLLPGSTRLCLPWMWGSKTRLPVCMQVRVRVCVCDLRYETLMLDKGAWMLFLGCIQSHFDSLISEGWSPDRNGPEGQCGVSFGHSEEWLQWC